MLQTRWYLNFNHLWSTGFGLGFLPIAPGTWGSLLILPLAWLMKGYDIKIQLSLWLCLILYSCWTASKTAALLNTKDPGCIVCDEVVGGWLPFMFIDWQWQSVLMAFLLFRFFDIVKVWPACFFDKRPEGWAIVLDDVVAGGYALLVLFLLKGIVAS